MDIVKSIASSRVRFTDKLAKILKLCFGENLKIIKPEDSGLLLFEGGELLVCADIASKHFKVLANSFTKNLRNLARFDLLQKPAVALAADNNLPFVDRWSLYYIPPGGPVDVSDIKLDREKRLDVEQYVREERKRRHSVRCTAANSGNAVRCFPIEYYNYSNIDCVKDLFHATDRDLQDSVNRELTRVKALQLMRDLDRHTLLKRRTTRDRLARAHRSSRMATSSNSSTTDCSQSSIIQSQRSSSSSSSDSYDELAGARLHIDEKDVKDTQQTIDGLRTDSDSSSEDF